MGKVIYDISMSLDGLVAGANVRPEAGLGDGGEQLHAWGIQEPDPRNREIVESWSNTGAVIVGRTTYNLHTLLGSKRTNGRCPDTNCRRFAQRAPGHSRWRCLHFCWQRPSRAGNSEKSCRG